MTTGTSPPATPPPASASRLGAPLPPTRFGTTPRSRLPRGDVASFPGTTSTRPLAGRPTRATVAGDGPFTGRERRPLHRRPRPIRRWHLARRRVVAFVRVVGGRPVGFRPRSRTSPVPAPGTRLDRTRTLRAPVRVTHPHAVPARHGGRARRLPRAPRAPRRAPPRQTLRPLLRRRSRRGRRHPAARRRRRRHRRRRARRRVEDARPAPHTSPRSEQTRG